MKYHNGLFFCFILFFFCLSANVKAQQQRSYILTGDTKTLDVKLAWTKGWHQYYEVIVLSKDAPKTYTAKDLDGYQTTWNGPFISYEVEPDDWVFLELMESGELELYKYIDKDFKSHYYVKRFDQNPIQL